MSLKEWYETNLSKMDLDEDHLNYLISRGALEEDVRKWGIHTFVLCEEPGEDSPFWRSLEGSLVVPIYTPLGDLVGIEYRLSLKESPKKFFFQKKERRPYFFGLPFVMEEIWNTRKVSLVEGHMDTLVLKRVLPLPVLGAGTANLSESQIRFLERFTDEVKVFFDQDSPGDLGYFAAKKRLSRKDFVFSRERYGVEGDDPPKIWDRGGLSLLQREFEGRY